MNDNPLVQIFGEVLFDHFPDGSRVLGGAPFNVAWHLQAFGLAPRFISRIGDDASGREVLQLMNEWGMSPEALQIDSKHATGSVQVEIDDGEPHYQIVEDRAYDFIASESLEKRATEGILYHGSLAVRNPFSRAALATLKSRHLGKVFIDVNLRPPWWEKNTLLDLLKDANWVKLNESELIELSGTDLAFEEAVRGFLRTFDLDALVVTRGALGAVAWDGHDWVTVAPEVNTDVVDTVGAGDAFASVLLLGLCKRWPLQATLERAQAFASALVGQRGATVADPDFYRAFSQQWSLS